MHDWTKRLRLPSTSRSESMRTEGRLGPVGVMVALPNTWLPCPVPSEAILKECQEVGETGKLRDQSLRVLGGVAVSCACSVSQCALTEFINRLSNALDIAVSYGVYPTRYLPKVRYCISKYLSHDIRWLHTLPYLHYGSYRSHETDHFSRYEIWHVGRQK